MALFRSQSGGGGGAPLFTLNNVGGTWYIISNEGVIKTQTGGWGNALSFSDDGGYITVTSSASSYNYTVTFNKPCNTVITLSSNGTTSTSSKTAGGTIACDVTSIGFLAIFD